MQLVWTKQRIALRGVTESSNEYQEALSFIDKTSRDFAIPQEILTRQFTKLRHLSLGLAAALRMLKLPLRALLLAFAALVEICRISILR
jgi:hypothetical protein